MVCECAGAARISCALSLCGGAAHASGIMAAPAITEGLSGKLAVKGRPGCTRQSLTCCVPRMGIARRPH
eukprot:scaffold46734_cov26-Tisochrysis_lutea.AAC.1